ncbi:MAG: FHA domain-containing protein, partial [Planctomycetota bacterium]|nr:FHA domain-containing protein [Planctomycetota bacterium]
MKLWINTDGKIQEHLISQTGTTSIGRGDENNLVLKDRDISRFHCEIVAEGDGCFELYDLDSTNGTFLNGSKIQKATLVPGDTVQIGDTLMIVNSLHESRRVPLPKNKALTPRSSTRASRPPNDETDLHDNPLRNSLRGRFHQLIVATQRIAAELDNTKLLDVVLTGAARFAYATRGMVYLKSENDYQFAVGYNLKESDLEDAEKAFIEALTSRAEVQLDIVQHAFRVGDKRKI